MTKLQVELMARKITITQLSETISVGRVATTKKLEDGNFSIKEIGIIRDTYFAEHPLDLIIQLANEEYVCLKNQ